MKKKVYIGIVSAMIVVGMLVTSSLAGFALTISKAATADPTVTLQKVSDSGIGFTFNRDNTDLFDNFKGLVPGDKVVQTIVLKNKVKETAQGSSYNIFVYAENAGAEKQDGTKAPSDIFEKVKISVSQNDKVKDLKKTGSDSKGAFLGNFKFDDSSLLKVAIEFPKELGNEYQNCIGKINWYFYAEQVVKREEETIDDDNPPLNPPIQPAEPTLPPFETIKDDEVPLQGLPKTGEDSQIVFFEIAAAISITILAGLNSVRVINKRKSKDWGLKI